MGTIIIILKSLAENKMKLNDTNAFSNLSLYLDIIYFSATKYLCTEKSVKIKRSTLVIFLAGESPVIVGQFKEFEVAHAIKDIYKKCHKNNRKNRKTIKLSRKHLVEYLKTHMINMEGIPWL